MKQKIIKDWKNISAEELFLYELGNNLLHFINVDRTEIVEFCRFCINYKLLNFIKQREHNGFAAEFHVLKDFNIQWKSTNYKHELPIYTMQKNDSLIVTQFLDSSEKKRGLMNLYDEWRVTAYIPADNSKLTFYKRVKEILCEK